MLYQSPDGRAVVDAAVGADRGRGGRSRVDPAALGWLDVGDARGRRPRRRGRPTVVLRRMFREPWRTHARELLRREADVLRMLSGGAVPVATPIAVDERAEATDHPALLMTHLPGRLRLDEAATSAALADMLVRIHQVRPTTRPRAYQSWAVPERRVIPAWSERPRCGSVRSPRSPRSAAYRGCFLHRDFHPGNVLFDGDAISGVVDWVETSWGPADLDVAHCSTALALLHGPAAVNSSARTTERRAASSAASRTGRSSTPSATSPIPRRSRRHGAAPDDQTSARHSRAGASRPTSLGRSHSAVVEPRADSARHGV